MNLAHQIISDDLKINEKRYEIEKHSIKIIAENCPSIVDLNTIVSVLTIINELEESEITLPALPR